MRYALLLLLLIQSTLGMAEDMVVLHPSLIEERDGIAYQMGSDQPFTGSVVSTFVSGNKSSEMSYKNGLRDGPATTWYENGHLRLKSEYREGVRVGRWTSWDENGHVMFQKEYVNGRLRRF